MPAQTVLPPRFLVGSLAESLTEVPGGMAAARFQIADCLFPYRLPLTVTVACKQGRRGRTVGLDVADEVACIDAIGALPGPGLNEEFGRGR